MADPLPAWDNPASPLNGSEFFSGTACVESGCQNPAGTAWSPHWCWQHNAERMRRLRKQFELLEAECAKEAGRD